jgi:uncharacterized protein (TIGR02246 family)
MERALDEVYLEFARAYEALDAERVAALYADEALYLAPNRAALRGRHAIHASFIQSFERVAQRGESVRIAFNRFHRRLEGDLAYEVGYFEVTYTPADGGPARTSRGKVVVVLRVQVDGRWRFEVDGYSSLPEDPATTE